MIEALGSTSQQVNSQQKKQNKTKQKKKLDKESNIEI